MIVRLVATPEQVRLAVEDDGRGFETSESQETGTLIGCASAEVLGGALEVYSEKGAGTRIEATIPLEKP